MNGTKEGQLPSERALAQFLAENDIKIQPVEIANPYALKIQLDEKHLPSLEDALSVNGLDGSEKHGLFQRALQWSPALVAVAGAPFVLGAGGQADNENTTPPAVVQSVDTVLPDVQVFPQEPATPTPNPNYIPDEEEPNPEGPPVVEDDGDPNNDPPLPLPTPIPHPEEFQLITKKKLVAPNGQESPLNQQFEAGIDWNRNNVLDPSEITEGAMTGNDGEEVISFTVDDNVEGLNVCVKEINIAPELEPVPNASTGGGTGEGCDTVDAASKIAEVILRNRNRVASPTPVVTPPPSPTATPQPTATPSPTGIPSPTETPTLTPRPTPTVTPAPTPEATPAPTGGPTPGPQPEVCPEGQVLPDVFQGGDLSGNFGELENQHEEIKCEIIGLSEQLDEHDQNMTEQHEGQDKLNTKWHKWILNAINNHAEESSEEHEEQTNILRNIWNRVRNGGHDIWDRIDVGASVVAGAGVLYLIFRSRRRGEPEVEEVVVEEGPADGGQGPTPKQEQPEGGEAASLEEASTAGPEDVSRFAAVVTEGEDEGKIKESKFMLSPEQFQAFVTLFTRALEKLSDEELQELVTAEIRDALLAGGFIDEKQKEAMSNREIAELAALNLAAPVYQLATQHQDRLNLSQDQLDQLKAFVDQVEREQQTGVQGAVTEGKDEGKDEGVKQVRTPVEGKPERITVRFEGGKTEVYVGRGFTKKSGTSYEVTEIGPDGNHFTLLNKRENNRVKYSRKQMVELIIEDRERRVEDRQKRIQQAVA